ncbi:MAG: DegT/DnrJ/EryC1/StrS family aminotransferase [Eubacteriales bacterium]
MYRFGKEEIEAFTRVAESGSLFKINNSLQEVFHCEEELKALMNTDYALLMTSGKAAIICALVGLGIGPGDEVIIPAYTYIATAIAVTAVGAIPVICEVDDTLTIDVADAEKKISKYTKAIIPVHIQGFPSNMDALCLLAEKYHIAVVEDACQSVGGSYKSRRLGSIGIAGSFSFNYFKVISSGEGGALFTSDRTIYERALIHHDSSAIAYFGTQLDGVNEPQFCGNEYRIGEITGAVLRSQLKKLDGILADLHKNKMLLMAALSDVLKFAPSHDIVGDCAVTLPVRFDTQVEARHFGNAIGGTLPIDTGKHVYSNWTPVMEKRGAFHPLMDPFKMEANRELNHNYTLDMCPRTLDLLARTVYIGINPDWNDEALTAVAKRCRDALTTG